MFAHKKFQSLKAKHINASHINNYIFPYARCILWMKYVSFVWQAEAQNPDTLRAQSHRFGKFIHMNKSIFSIQYKVEIYDAS